MVLIETMRLLLGLDHLDVARLNYPTHYSTPVFHMLDEKTPFDIVLTLKNFLNSHEITDPCFVTVVTNFRRIILMKFAKLALLKMCFILET